MFFKVNLWKYEYISVYVQDKHGSSDQRYYVIMPHSHILSFSLAILRTTLSYAHVELQEYELN